MHYTIPTITYVLFSRAFEFTLISSAVSSSSEKMVVCWYKYTRMITYLIITLFASTFTQKGFMAQGREMPTLTESPKMGMEERGHGKEWKAQMIGSRPPKCEGRCRSCGRCEAVQVPVIPQVQGHGRSRTTHFSATRAIPHSRGDDLSNYKPMSWKCKCGNYFFNP